MSTENTQVAVTKDITVQVLAKVNSFQESGELTLPKEYSVENALKSSYLILNELKNKGGKPVLEACTKTSIANSLLSMITWGLSPVKSQVYFIPYGNQLQISKSYLGNIAIAKRVANVQEVRANCIYDGDDFDYEIDINTGRLKIIKHKPDLANINEDKIKGAYAVVNYKDGSTSVEVMNMAQIKQAWMQGASKGGSPAHTKFSSEMAKKTVINRALKIVIGSSDDSGLYEEKETQSTSDAVAEEISEKANIEMISFDTVEEAEVFDVEKQENTEKISFDKEPTTLFPEAEKPNAINNSKGSEF